MMGHPNPLAKDYSRFRVEDRVLLSGHSHQAWPDCAYEAQKLAWRHAAELVDDKWEKAFEMAERVRAGFSHLMDDEEGHISLGASTHDLVIKFLSALPLMEKPRLVTTDGEFHTLRRQLARLSEEGVEVKIVNTQPLSSLAERTAQAVDQNTAAVLISCVLYESAAIVQDLGHVMERCAFHGAELLIDAYHALNVIPFSIKKEKFQQAFVVGGGYKYCQLGEGNGFLRFPKDCKMRPIITGWFTEFDLLTDNLKDSRAPYGQGPALFAGATYDPVSHYRAAGVFDYFKEKELNPLALRKISLHQVGLLTRLFDELDLNPRLITRDSTLPPDQRAGFLALISPKAKQLCSALKQEDIFTDCRGPILRLGPAPYLSDQQLIQAMEALGALIKKMN